MAEIKFHENACHTSGNLPEVGSNAPDFTLTTNELADVSLQDYAGKKKVLSIVPSLDTGICAISTRKFNEQAASMDNVSMLVISSDLPFAQSRFCDTENIENLQTLSCFRSNFAQEYGIKIVDGPLTGVTARAIVVVDENNKVIHSQLVPEIAQEPDYQAVMASL